MTLIEVFQNILKCKWTLMILERLRDGVRRPGELRRSLQGLSSKVMYDRLKMLEDHRIVERKLVQDKPLEVHYELTERGRKVSEIIAQIQFLG
jgi:DNA-binding HxlR family transcriptional regulator